MDDVLLVVEDEKDINDLICLYLKNEGFRYVSCRNGEQALSALEENTFSLALLDIMLPDISGFELCRRIREKYLFPIIMLTAKVEAIDKITGLSLGADDYITKPFHPLEMIARIKTQLRRYTRYNMASHQSEPDHIHDFLGLYISLDEHRCFYNEKEIFLTPIEFDILWTLCSARGQVVSSEALFETVWKEKYYHNNNTVMAHIARLRDKLGDNKKNKRLIKTVWGVGYTIEKE